MSANTETKPTVELVNVQINGTWHQFPKGTRMIEAIKAAAVEVPHYCYHPKLSSPGNCRMCLVEMGMPTRPAPGAEPPQRDKDGFLPIQWIPRPVISCANTVADNMGIRTESTLVKECRNGVMEFLLANHPLDCPICDQAGECTLQEFAVGYGRGGSRFKEQKVKKPKNVQIGPRIRLDDERCVLCSRCIRFMDEVGDDPVLGFTERGSHTLLSVHPDRTLDSNYSLNTADICPVGALTSTDFRFQMRVWFLRETKSIDTNCGTGCNTTIWSRGDQVYRVTPRENNEVNSCWMPDSHRLNFHYLHSETRLTQPLIMEGTSHRQAEWAEAINTTARKLQSFPAEHIAIIASARMTNEELFMVHRLANQLKISHLDLVPRIGESDGKLISADRNPNSEGARHILKIDKPGSKLQTIRQAIMDGHIKALVVLGENLLKEAGFNNEHLDKLDFLAQQHILANPTAAKAHVVLPGAGFAEKQGSMINVTGRLQRLNKAIPTPGGAREDWEILRDLILALGGGNGIHLITECYSSMAAEIDIFKNTSMAKIGDQGIQLYQSGVKIPLLEKEKERIQKGEITG